MIYDITLTVVDSSTSTTHAGAAVSIEVVQVVGQVNTGDGGAVTSVAGRTGDVTLTKTDVGLANVDNTADTAKPVSTLQAAADTAAQAAAEATAATELSTHSSTTSGVHGISAFGATLVDDADASAARTTLGLGTAATAATGDFAAASHTHILSSLTQSGATTNQIIQWNGTNWVPVTFTSGIGGTLGSTDNALTRADGTGGSTAQGSGVTLDDSANLAATNWTVGSGTYSTRTYARIGAVASNLALIISPTGTGFLSMQVPDGTTAGGNLRGDNAVDFGHSRSTATQVASGNGSFCAGAAATASGTGSFSFRCNVTGSGAMGMGQSSSVSGTTAFNAGPFSTVSGQSASSVGEGHTASGQGCFTWGLYNASSALASSAGGYYASSTLYGQRSNASGRFAATGDCQSSNLTARRATADATPSNLFLDGSSARLVVPANSSGVAMITVVARTATAGAETMTWRRRVNWWRGVGVGTVDIDVETVGTDRGRTGGTWGAGPAWTLAIAADTTNGAINVIGTGAAATNIRWGASVEWIETTFA